MVTNEVEITNPVGIHLRPAMFLCEEAQKYECQIFFQVHDRQINLKSILNVLAAKIRCGDKVTVICDGVDETDAMITMCKILQETKEKESE